MLNEVSEEFLPHVVQRPEYLQAAKVSSRKYDLLAQSLNVLAGDKAIGFALPEIQSKFGKSWKTAIKFQMKKRGVKVAIALEKETIYLWKRGA